MVRGAAKRARDERAAMREDAIVRFVKSVCLFGMCNWWWSGMFNGMVLPREK